MRTFFSGLEIEGEWDDTDDGFFEQLYGSSIGPDPKTQTWETEEGEAGGYDTETKTWPPEKRATYRSWSPEAGAWKTKKDHARPRVNNDNHTSGQEDFAVLAGLLSVVIEKLDQISAKMDTPQQTIQTKKTEPKDFASFIKHKESIDKILELLHSWIDKKKRVKALVYIKAAMDANIFEPRPTYDAAKAEFPESLGSRSLYYYYTSEPLAFTDKDDLETLKQSIALLQKFKE